ncbi:MAG: heparan-alpha-glucosaminide N-acetyltransferase [Alsobacter sp.]
MALETETPPSLPPPPLLGRRPPAGWDLPRIPLLDVARGVALVAMAIYHFTWDLGFFRFTTIQAGVDPGWRLFAKLIAGSFLVLVGVGLVLAHGQGVRWPAFWRRFAILVLAAGGITLATWYAMPEAFIYFGILHCIALSSLLALPFLRAPLGLVVAAAALAFALPALGPFPVFAHPAWLWLGLSPTVPTTNDYEPILPWIGAVLLGVAAARTAVGLGWAARLAKVRADDPVSRGLALAGRHSLLVYLAHQPVLFGAVALAAAVFGSPAPVGPRGAAGGFETSCVRTCVDQGSGAAFCEATCGCVASRLAGTPLVTAPADRPLSEVDRLQLDVAVKACLPAKEP